MSRKTRSLCSIIVIVFLACLVGLVVGCSSGTVPSSPDPSGREVVATGDLTPVTTARLVPSVPAGQRYDPVDPFAVLIEVLEPLTAADLDSMGAIPLATYPEIHVLKVSSSDGMPSEDFARMLINDQRVLSAQADRRLQNPESRSMALSFSDGLLNHDHFVTQSFLGRLKAREAHAICNGRGSLVAILDTGIDAGHPDLAGHYRRGYDLLDRDGLPWEEADGVDDDGDGVVDEAYGHGTHVAGLVALLAPSAEILCYRVQDSEGWGNASDVVEAVLLAVRDGADAINLSLGMYTSFRALELAVTYAFDHGIPVVASAGNDGWATRRQYPAGYSEVVAVASVDSLDRLSGFSSYGDHIDVAAPGEFILSTSPGGRYAVWSGTSMSAPMVSALCAVLRSRWPGLSVGATIDILARSTAPGTAVPGVTGYGRIDFLKALEPFPRPGATVENPRTEQEG
jgi:subtilisin family serine protease